MSTKERQPGASGTGGDTRCSETAVLRGVAVLVMLACLLLLAPWVVGTVWQEAPLSPVSMMRPSTTLGLLFIGAAILLQTLRGRACSSAGRLALAFSAGAGAIAMATLFEHSLGLDLGIDHLLGADPYGRWKAPSGRMGLNGAVCLLLSALSASILRRPERERANNAALALFGAMSSAISLAAIAAHIEAGRAGYNWLNMISMSVPAALLYTIQGGTFVWVAARRAGFRWALGRGLTLEFANGVALLLAVAVMAYLSTLKFANTTGEIRRSGEVRDQVSALRAAVDRLDTALHGALGSGVADVGLQPDKTEPSLNTLLPELHGILSRSVRGDPEQESRVKQLGEAVGRWGDFHRDTMALAATQGRDTAIRKMLAPSTQQARTLLYGLLSDVAESERRRVSSSEKRLYKELERTFGLVPLGALVGTLVLSYSVIRLSIEMDTRERIAKALQLTEARQRLAVEAAGIGDWELNPATHVMTRSARYDQIFGYSEPLPEWGYETFLEHVHPEDRARVDSLYRHSIEEGGDWMMECRIRKRDGTAGWIWLRGRCFKDESGLVETVRGVLGDVTERRKAEEEIRSLNASLEQRVRERTEKLELTVKELDAFTYSVSHDLRAPLRAIDGFSKLVIEDHSAQLPQEARRKLAVVSSEAQRMSRLIDDLLSFSRLGRAQVHPEQIDMQVLAKEVFEELQELGANTRKINFKVHPMPAAMGTQPMVRQVWTNLIGNALKFTRGREPAQIEIGCRSDPQGENAYYIKDNGVGFDMRHAGKLFGVFQRLHSDKEFEGTGAGLALVQRIVNRHGGKVWAEAAPDQGATFFFTLPTPNV